MGFYVQSGAHLVRKRFRTCQSVAVSLILARGRSQGDLLVSTQGKGGPYTTYRRACDCFVVIFLFLRNVGHVSWKNSG